MIHHCSRSLKLGSNQFTFVLDITALVNIFTNKIPFSRSNQHDNVHKMVEAIDSATTAKGNHFYLCM